METLQELVDGFLAEKSIAVAGVSRAGQSVGNPIAAKLRKAGHEVFALNPEATEIDGYPAYPGLGSLPRSVGAVVIATAPEAALSVAHDCIDHGVRSVWFHRAFGNGSYSKEAVEACREAGIKVIDGACPLMYIAPIDFGHRCFRWIMKVTGKLPQPEHSGMEVATG